MCRGCPHSKHWGASGPEGCQLQRGLAWLGPQAWAGRTQGPTCCCAPCLALLRMGPVGESSAGAGELVGFSIGKPPPEKPGGSSGVCRWWGLRGPGGAGGCDKLAEKRALGVGRWGGALQPLAAPLRGAGEGLGLRMPVSWGWIPRKGNLRKNTAHLRNQSALWAGRALV